MRARLHDRGLVSGAATYLLSNVANAAIPFALLPVLTRHLVPSEYGEVAMFQTLLAALAAVVGLSVTGSAGRKFYDDDLTPGESRYFIGACFQILAVSSAAALFLLFAFRQPLSAWLGLGVPWIFAACITAAANFVVQVRMGQWQVRQQARRYGALQVAQSGCNVSLSLILVLAFGLGASGRIGAQVVTSLAFAGVALVLLRKDALLGFAWRPEHVKEALRFGVPLVPHAVGLLLFGILDRFVVNSELGLAQVGIYMVAFQLASTMGLVFGAVNSAYVPWLFERLKRNDTDERRYLVKTTYTYFMMALSAAGLAFLVGPICVRIIAGEGYAAAGDAVGWLALAQAFGGMYLMVTNYIFYSKRTGLLALVTVSSGLLNVALLLVLVRSHGLVGAAVASAVAMGLRFLLTWVVAQRRHPMPWFSFHLRDGVDAAG